MGSASGEGRTNRSGAAVAAWTPGGDAVSKAGAASGVGSAVGTGVAQEARRKAINEQDTAISGQRSATERFLE